MGNTAARRRGRPPGPPVDAAARREELLDAAERVIAERGPVPALADVAAAAGYARTAIYAAFGDQHALVHALAARHTDAIIERTNLVLAQEFPLRDLLPEVIDVFCAFVEANPDLHRTLMLDIEVGGRPMMRRSTDWASGVLTVVLARCRLPGQPARPWAAAMVGAIIAATEDWIADPERGPRAALVADLTALFLPTFEAIGVADLPGPFAAALPAR